MVAQIRAKHRKDLELYERRKQAQAEVCQGVTKWSDEYFPGLRRNLIEVKHYAQNKASQIWDEIRDGDRRCEHIHVFKDYY